MASLAFGSIAAGDDGSDGDGSPPWPLGIAPAPSEIAALVSAADELYRRERTDEFLEAAERGEDAEHIYMRQEDIDAGLFDLDRIFRFGDALFEHEFRAEDGFGGSGLFRLHRVQNGPRGGLDSFSCAGCHSVGGPDGAGSVTENAFVGGDGAHLASADARNAPHVLGLGLVQALGAEMSFELASQREAAIVEATATGGEVVTELSAKEITFGSLTALPDGSVDLSGVRGVSQDLVVRPFGWKGDVARLRRFVEQAANKHFGEQAHTLALAAKDAPDPEHLGSGPWYDPDGDGVQRELEEGTVTAVALYLAMLEVPVMLPPSDAGLRARWANGSALFDEVGCQTCHTRKLQLDYVFWDELPDTTGGPAVRLNLLADGDAPRGSGQVELFSDLKRHDLGPELADKNPSELGIATSEFLTRPLWGLAETAPFLHDGRALTIGDAITAHGGEATDSRAAYLALDEPARADLAIFLMSLTRTPKLKVPR